MTRLRDIVTGDTTGRMMSALIDPEISNVLRHKEIRLISYRQLIKS
jgi:hypothetical protein